MYLWANKTLLHMYSLTFIAAVMMLSDTKPNFSD